ncbi:phosphopantetheine-binding protein [Nocardia huaxiensis]|uniref:Carrier domain-containing protein n=1 Tax=Nocardia huaxiensis TaxID=2755382 RepID=A0A7D6Z5K6_9NOCA|nr:phosphopantetheine-binding protein [Nocardia huaxiensis]QLY33566.1 hypothetical protein H0264_16215 [Nocardia huaxiensis]UFS99515.1 phosphopantetheine-binding protein [Nocardia huaxiensis]
MTPFEHEIRATVAAVVQRAPEEFDSRTSLVDQGIDSLAIMSLATTWQHEGHDIAYGDLISEPTITAWAALLGNRVVPRR